MTYYCHNLSIIHWKCKFAWLLSKANSIFCESDLKKEKCWWQYNIYLLFEFEYNSLNIWWIINFPLWYILRIKSFIESQKLSTMKNVAIFFIKSVKNLYQYVDVVIITEAAFLFRQRDERENETKYFWLDRSKIFQNIKLTPTWTCFSG